jgi:hypothetical protein
MQLQELVEQVPGFDSAAPKERIKLFAWWLHTHAGKELFGSAEIRGCYGQLHLDEPPALATYMARMADAKELLKDKGHYKLARQARAELDKNYGVHHSVVQVSKLLADLPIQVPDIAEKAFPVEAMKCYRVEAYRACIVMTWNLAFDHLLNWILKDATRLADFNAAIGKRYPKKTGMVVSMRDHFEDLKESETVEICNTAGLMSDDIIKILREKLIKRNIAAHPSKVVVVQSQADDVVTDLVNNVVLLLI